jgi:hypothetical protein
MSWELVKRCTIAIAAFAAPPEAIASSQDGRIWGTGFFISPDGHLLTCAHVVEDAGGWEQVRVNGQPVGLVYLGRSTQDDFAILQVSDYQGQAVSLSLTFEPMNRFLSIGYFLLLLSEKSATSEMVTEEVRRARELRDLPKAAALRYRRSEHKPIILPIRVNFPIDSPLNYDLRGYLQRIQQQEWKSSADTPVLGKTQIGGGAFHRSLRSSGY